MFFVRLELLGGEEIREAIGAARDTAIDLELVCFDVNGVVFEHNGKDVFVGPDSDVEELVKSHERNPQ